jgi:hypothetical protein
LASQSLWLVRPRQKPMDPEAIRRLASNVLVLEWGEKSGSFSEIVTYGVWPRHAAAECGSYDVPWKLPAGSWNPAKRVLVVKLEQNT